MTVIVRSDRAGVGVENRSRGMSPMFLATLSVADHDGMRGFPCRAASQPHQHPLHTYATVRNLGPSRLAGRSAMMADENGAAARSFHLFLPLFRRLGSALSLARPPWRERRTYVADSQHHWAIPVEQAQRAHTPHA